jgi:hypothetical protein
MFGFFFPLSISSSFQVCLLAWWNYPLMDAKRECDQECDGLGSQLSDALVVALFSSRLGCLHYGSIKDWEEAIGTVHEASWIAKCTWGKMSSDWPGARFLAVPSGSNVVPPWRLDDRFRFTCNPKTCSPFHIDIHVVARHVSWLAKQ